MCLGSDEEEREREMLSDLLEKRNLPALQDREHMLNVLQNEVYGVIPRKPERLSFGEEENIIRRFCAGKATCSRVTANVVVGGREFSFPFYVALPTAGAKYPFFIHINFRDNIPDLYMPTEELIDHGFAVLSFCYQDVTSDSGDFHDGLAGVLYPDGQRDQNEAGKIAMWAWAAQRVMDYAETRSDVLDLDCAIVCGHSRLGKTALLAAAVDERFSFAYSNDSGCAGAAISRGKEGENVKKISGKFPYWFCENYQKYGDREEEMPFDQHCLVASIAPRKVLIGSASEDAWADPLSEMLCCLAASPAFEQGFVCEDRLPEPGDKWFNGDIGYHLRKGLHYFSREDWLRLIEFVNRHR